MPSTPDHYIPRPDAEFDAWQENFYGPASDVLSNHPGNEQLIEAIFAAHDAWFYQYYGHVQAVASARAQTERKNAARAEYEQLIRQATRLIQTYPDTTDAQRAVMGITVARKKGVGANGGGERENPLRSRPIGRVERSQRMMHVLRFADESTPTRKAKPAGALGAEVRVALAAPAAFTPTDPESMRYLGLATDGTIEAKFPPQAAGQIATYVLRWVGPRGAVGPWSDNITAIVAA